LVDLVDLISKNGKWAKWGRRHSLFSLQDGQFQSFSQVQSHCSSFLGFIHVVSCNFYFLKLLGNNHMWDLIGQGGIGANDKMQSD